MAAARDAFGTYAELFSEQIYAPSPATIQAVFDATTADPANVATNEEMLVRIGNSAQSVLPFILMTTANQVRLVFNIVKVADTIGPGRSRLANTFVGMEGDLRPLNHAPTFVEVPTALMDRAHVVFGPTVAHADALLAQAPLNGEGFLHPAPAAADGDHTELRVRYLQPVTWDLAQLVLANPDMGPAEAYRTLDGAIRALPQPDALRPVREWLRVALCQSSLVAANSRVSRAALTVARTDEGFEAQVTPMLKEQLPRVFDPAMAAMTAQAPFTVAAQQLALAGQNIVTATTQAVAQTVRRNKSVRDKWGTAVGHLLVKQGVQDDTQVTADMRDVAAANKGQERETIQRGVKRMAAKLKLESVPIVSPDMKDEVTQALLVKGAKGEWLDSIANPISIRLEDDLTEGATALQLALANNDLAEGGVLQSSDQRLAVAEKYRNSLPDGELSIHELARRLEGYAVWAAYQYGENDPYAVSIRSVAIPSWKKLHAQLRREVVFDKHAPLKTMALLWYRCWTHLEARSLIEPPTAAAPNYVLPPLPTFAGLITEINEGKDVSQTRIPPSYLMVQPGANSGTSDGGGQQGGTPPGGGTTSEQQELAALQAKMQRGETLTRSEQNKLIRANMVGRKVNPTQTYLVPDVWPKRCNVVESLIAKLARLPWSWFM